MSTCQQFAMGFVARWSKFLTEIDAFSQEFKKKSNDDESKKKSQRIRKDFCEVEQKNQELRSLELEVADNTKESSQPKNNASAPIILQGNTLNNEVLNGHNESPLTGDSPILLSEILEKDEKKSKLEAAPLQKKKKLIKLKEKENELKEREEKVQEEKESEEWLLKKKIKKEKRKKKLLDTDDSDLDFKIKKKAK